MSDPIQMALSEGRDVVVTVKLWWRSRTLMVNALVLALAAAEAQFGLLQPYLPGNVYAWIAFSLPVVNAVLRVITVAPLVAAGNK
ncbi:MAG: hypothetical protein PHH47_10130 [Gallionella sp.]|nr:hypothetical protein [Gallionella sp.]MDD4946458.1 hypothetical protein [Gallionella sp.]